MKQIWLRQVCACVIIFGMHTQLSNAVTEEEFQTMKQNLRDVGTLVEQITKRMGLLQNKVDEMSAKIDRSMAQTNQRFANMQDTYENRFTMADMARETFKNKVRMELSQMTVTKGKGAKGESGAPGSKGEPGSPGISGLAGTAGPTGPPGEKGQKGEGGAGNVWTSGPGNRGTQKVCCNSKGQKGQRGNSGSSGVRGFAGPPGAPGLQGPAGPQGPSGRPGQKGETGENGRDGYPGRPGPRGPPGEKGDKGVAGEGRRFIQDSTKLTNRTPNSFINPQTGEAIMYEDCAAHYKHGDTISGRKMIYPTGLGCNGINTMCDQTNGGWTVILHRESATSVNFDATSNELENGFGQSGSSFQPSFYLGHEKIHRITTSGHWKLKLELTKLDGTVLTGEYGSFHLGSRSKGYEFHVDNWKGGSTTNILDCRYTLNKDTLSKIGIPLNKVLNSIPRSNTDAKAELVLGQNKASFKTKGQRGDHCTGLTGSFWYHGQLSTVFRLKTCFNIPLMGKMCTPLPDHKVTLPLRHCGFLGNVFSRFTPTYNTCQTSGDPKEVLLNNPLLQSTIGFSRSLRTVRFLIQRE